MDTAAILTVGVVILVTVFCLFGYFTGRRYGTPEEIRDEDLTVKILYHDEMMPRVEKFTQGDWIDLRTAEEETMHPGESKLISLGISMKLPEGYEAHIIPRSSTFKGWGIILVNGMGLIDNSYSGTNDIWQFPALATRTTTIEKGDRICQFRLVKVQDPIEFVEVDELDPVDRGGIGSTGVR